MGAVLFNLGLIYLRSDHPDLATEALKQALTFSRQDLVVGRSAALIELGEIDQANGLLIFALEAAPEDARLYNNLGLIAKIQGRIEDARGLFTRAVSLAPDWPAPQQNLESLPVLPASEEE